MPDKYNFTRNALISVSDKRGLAQLAKGLTNLNFRLIASGKNADYLKRHGIKALKTSKLTGWPPIMNPQGVKTIHPRIYGGIFINKQNESHLRDAKKFKIIPFDIVVCNFYPFEKTISKRRFKHEDAIRNLDIGGPCMVRAAAKHYLYRTVLVDPKDYNEVLDELKNSNEVSLATRQKLAIKAFRFCMNYDRIIISYLKKVLK